MTPTPEHEARERIDVALQAVGWVIQDRKEMNLSAGLGVAVCEFKMASGHGFADYTLFVGGKAVGSLEAKRKGYPLTSVELQAEQYATGLPDGLNPPVYPLPFLYISTGSKTRFINLLDPDPKTRAISCNLPHIHRPSTLAEWFATHKDQELVPFGDQVRDRFDHWLEQQRGQGRTFTPAQRRWLEMMRDHIATSLEIAVEDLDYAPFAEEGGLGCAAQVFGGDLRKLLEELNGILAA